MPAARGAGAVNQDAPEFWQELGKTVAAFGYLEHILTKTCYALLTTAEKAADLVDGSDEALSRWYERIVRSQTDSLYGLTRELERLLGVGSDRSALPALRPVGFSSPPSEPDVHLSLCIRLSKGSREVGRLHPVELEPCDR